MTFDYVSDPHVRNKSEALGEANKYLNASVTALFYMANVVHDVYYRWVYPFIKSNYLECN